MVALQVLRETDNPKIQASNHRTNLKCAKNPLSGKRVPPILLDPFSACPCSKPPAFRCTILRARRFVTSAGALEGLITASTLPLSDSIFKYFAFAQHCLTGNLPMNSHSVAKFEPVPSHSQMREALGGAQALSWMSATSIPTLIRLNFDEPQRLPRTSALLFKKSTRGPNC